MINKEISSAALVVSSSETPTANWCEVLVAEGAVGKESATDVFVGVTAASFLTLLVCSASTEQSLTTEVVPSAVKKCKHYSYITINCYKLMKCACSFDLRRNITT